MTDEQPTLGGDDQDSTGLAAAAGCLTGGAIATVFWLILTLALWRWLR